MIPAGDISSRPRRAFWRFFFATSALVVVVGVLSAPRDRGLPNALTLLLAYWFFMPGCLGLGWWLAYRLWMQHEVGRAAAHATQIAQQVFREAALRQGEVKFLDVAMRLGVVSGLAVAGTSLLVLENNRLRKVLRDEIREWRWQLEEPRLWRKPNGTIDITHQIDNDIEIRRVTTTNGFYIVTNDPAQPEILFRTNDEAVCKRWATVLNNIFEGRLQID